MTTRTDESWLQDLRLELRLQDWDGRQVGDAVATVREHCEESGESAQEAFGDPDAYGRALAQGSPGRAKPLTARVLLGALAGVLGTLTTSAAATAAFEGGPVEIRLGQVLILVLTLAAVVALVGRSGPVLRALVRIGPLRGGVIGAVVCAGLVLVGLLRPEVLVAVPAGPTAVGAVLLVAVATAVSWPDRHADPERDPRTGEEPRTRAAERLGPFVYPVAAVLVSALALVFHLLT